MRVELSLTGILRTLAVICVGGLAAGVSPALGAFPGENGKIAFDSDRDGGDIDIWTMSPDGSNLVNLTANSGAFDGLASWRADGRKIAFMSDRETPTQSRSPPALARRRDLRDERRTGRTRRRSPSTRSTTRTRPGRRTASGSSSSGTLASRGRGRLRHLHDERRRHQRAQRSRTARASTSSSPTGRRRPRASRSSATRDGDGEIYTMRPERLGRAAAHVQRASVTRAVRTGRPTAG